MNSVTGELAAKKSTAVFKVGDVKLCDLDAIIVRMPVQGLLKVYLSGLTSCGNWKPRNPCC